MLGIDLSLMLVNTLHPRLQKSIKSSSEVGYSETRAFGSLDFESFIFDIK